MIDLSVVIPAYREAQALATLLPSLRAVVTRLSPSHEILIVDAKDPVDNTQEICAREGVRYLQRGAGNHYGDAVRTGIAGASGRYVLFMDADGSHNPSQLHLLWERRHSSDMVIGSRYIAGGETENPKVLIAMSWIVNITYSYIFKLTVRDVSNSFRLYRADYLKAMPLRCNHFDIIQEILIRATRRGPMRVVEVPIRFEKRKAGESKRSLLRFAVSYLSTIVRLVRYCSSE